MSASTINAAAAPPSTGPASGIGAGPPAAQGPVAGFEALLAAFFGAQGLVTPGQPGKVATAKTGVSIDGGAAAEGDTPAAKVSDDPAATDAAAAATAAAACNAALVLPVVALPITAAPAATAATTGEVGGGAATATANAAAAFGLGKAAAKSQAPALPQVAGDEPLDAGAAADDAAGPEFDPGAALASAALKTAKLDPSATAKLNAAEPLRVAATPPAPIAAPPAAPAPPAAAPAAPAAPAPEPALTAPVVTAQAAATPQAAVDAKATERVGPGAPTTPKDKAQGVKPGRNDQGRVDLVSAAPGKAGLAATAGASANSTPDAGIEDHPALSAVADAKAEAPDAPAGSADAGAATASTTNATTQVHPGAIPVRGSPQTVANLAAQIAKKLEGRSTRFDVQLDPAGLGRVDVRMEIGASGRMTAAMTFDTPQAASELRARAAELQRHLEQAGFDMSGGLSFDVAGDRGQGRQAQQNQDNDSGQAFRGRAFQQALATAGDADQSAASGALNLRRSLLSGVDIRI
jgi:flagellar hook-length control protein FliK